MSKSEVILNALSKATKGCEELKFMSRIREESDYKFLCLGKENIILLNNNFEQTRSISYSSVEGIEISQISKNITLNIKGSPNYTFSIDDKDTMIEILQCAWLTDYMFRNAEYAKFPLKYKEDIKKVKPKPDERIEAAKAAIKTENVTIINGEFKGFGFLLANDFSPVPSKPGKYEHQESGATFTIEVSDELNVQFIQLMGVRQVLQNFAECYAHGMLPKEEYWIAWSKPYLKKWNVNEDIASWEGWEVFFRTKTHDYIVIIMRRRFSPPILDLFNDIACWYKGKIVTEGKLENNPHLLTCRGIVDTLHAKSKCDDYYKEIVGLKEQALLLGDDEINYLMSINEGAMGQNMKHAKKIIKMLRQYKEVKTGGKDRKGDSGDVMTVVKEMCDQTKLPEDLRYIWDCKVAEFLSTCLDREEDVSVFNLANSIVNLEITSDDATKIENLLQYLLHLRTSTQAYDPSQPFATLLIQFTSTLLQEKPHHQYLYNARVMRALIESGYISKILKLEKLTAYKRFIDCILMNINDSKLKLSALRQIREMFKDEFSDKKKADEQSLINYSLWLDPIITLLRSNWTLLVRIALNAVIQMLSTNPIIKEQLSTAPVLLDIIVNTFKNAKDDDTLEFAILPIYVLSEDRAFCDTFERKYKLLPSLFDVLKGTGIVGISHADYIKTRVIYVIGKICKAVPECLETIEKEGYVKYVVNLIECKDNFIPGVDVVKAVSSLLNLMAKKSKQIKSEHGKSSILYMLEILKANFGKEFLPPELLAKLARTLQELVSNNPENCMCLAENHDVLELYKKGKVSKSISTIYSNLLNYVLENIQLEAKQ